MTTSTAHAEAIRALPEDTRILVLLALAARAIDFGLDDDGGDEAADVVREFLPGEDEFPHSAHGRGFFQPDDWATTDGMIRFAVNHDPHDVEAWTDYMESM